MVQRGAPRIFISAGEPSGDLHGAGVVRALRARYPDATIEALGGPQMAQAGATLRYRMEGLAAFGLVEVVTKIRAHYRLLRALQNDFKVGRYDLVILVDYPGFHVRVAEAAHATGTKVLYYIAPQLWAWRPGRARRLAAAVDRLAWCCPSSRCSSADWGSERVCRTPAGRSGALAHSGAGRAQLGIPAVEPGARHLSGKSSAGDRRLWEPFRDAALQLLREGRCDRVLVAGIPEGQYPNPGPIEVLRGDPVPLFAAADAALAKSGTTTLEAALADTPMVVAYKVHPLTYAMFQRVRTVKWISLVNLVADREVVPEMLQERASAGELAAAVGPLLKPNDPRTVAQREGLALVRERLGEAGATTRVVALAAELLEPSD